MYKDVQRCRNKEMKEMKETRKHNSNHVEKTTQKKRTKGID